MSDSRDKTFHHVLLAAPAGTDVEASLTQCAAFQVQRVSDAQACRLACYQQPPHLIVIALPTAEALVLCNTLHSDGFSVLLILPPDADLDAALDSGATDVLMRPIAPRLLCHRVALLMSVKPQRTQPADIPPHTPLKKRHYRSLLDSTGDAILIIDTESRQVIDANPLALRWLDYTLEELYSLTIEQIMLAPEDGEETQTWSTTRQGLVSNGRYKAKDGRLIPVQVVSRVIRESDRIVLVNIARDVSRRIEMKTIAREQKHLAEALRFGAAALNSSLKLSEVLERILDALEQVVQADGVNLMLIADGVAAITAQRQYSTPYNTRHLKLKLVIDQTPTLRHMAETHQPLYIPDIPHEPRWMPDEHADWLRSYIGVPIVVGDEVVGFINIDGSRRHQFSQGLAQRLTGFADQAAVAIQNARLYESVQRYAADLEQRVTERTQALLTANTQLQSQIKERQHIEEVLSQERSLLRTVIDHLPDAVYVKDREGRFILLNKTVEQGLRRFLGDERSALGLRDADIMQSARAAEHRADELRIMQTGEARINKEWASHDPITGQRQWIQITKVPLYDSNGEISGIVGINHDITELRAAEDNLYRLTASAQMLLWHVRVEETETGQVWQTQVVNAEAAQRYLPVRRAPDQSYTDAWISSVFPEDLRAAEARFDQAVREGRSSYDQELRITDINGETRWLYETVQIIPLKPQVWQLIFVSTDITSLKQAEAALQRANETLERRVLERTEALYRTNQTLKQEITERRRIEKALRESEARFRALVEHAPEAIVVFDVVHEQFVSVNDNAAQLFGTPRQDLLHMSIHDLSPLHQPGSTQPARRLMRAHIQAAISGQTPVFEWVFRDRSDRLVQCEVRLLLLPTSSTQLIRGSITDITERKRAQYALEQSEVKYRTLTDQLPLGVYRSSWDGVIMVANRALARILGFERPEEIIGTSVLPFYQDPDARMRGLLHFTPDTNESMVDELRLIRQDGQRIWVRVTWRVIYDGGQPAYIDGTMQDITAERLAQQAEQDQRQFAQALQAATVDLNRSLDLETVLDNILKHIERVLPRHDSAGIELLENAETPQPDVIVIRYQRRKGEVLETIPIDARFKLDKVQNFVRMRDTRLPICITDTDRSADWQRDINATGWIKSYIGAPIISTGEVIGFINLASDTPGTFLPEHAQRLMAFADQVGIALENAQLYSEIQSHADELQRRVDERTAELRERTIQRTAILDALTEGVVFFNAAGERQYLNSSLTQLTGLDAAAIHTLDDLQKRIDLPAEQLEMLLKTCHDALDHDGMWQGTVRLQHSSGRVFDAQLSLIRVRDPETQAAPSKDSPALGTVLVMRDISEEKMLARQREQFISHASHELRTPITNMSTRLYLLRRQPEALDRHLDILETVTLRMRNLVEDLLDLSRLENGAVPLNALLMECGPLLRDVVAMQQEEASSKAQKLYLDLPDTPLYIVANPTRMERVLTNLIINAVNYTPQGGSIHVGLAEADADVCISVSDNGVGIPAEVMPTIFNPFVRANDDRSGAGLGLTITREIVEMYSGRINVESVEGEGTIFSVWMPRHFPEEDRTPDEQQGEMP